MMKRIVFILILVIIFPNHIKGHILNNSDTLKNEIQLNNLPQGIRNLPLIITTSKIENGNAPVALIISGDGGWRRFEQSIADKLGAMGIPTIGLDIKKYFWSRKTPEETTADMVAVFRYYLGEWKRKQLLLTGYSLGAEILPFVISRMPEEMKSMISLTVLLSPSPTTDFEVHVSDMLGVESKHNTFKVIDEIIKNQSVPSLCIFGSEEKTNVPALLKNTKVNIEKIPGDHHYKFDSGLIVQTMKNYGAF